MLYTEYFVYILLYSGVGGRGDRKRLGPEI